MEFETVSDGDLTLFSTEEVETETVVSVIDYTEHINALNNTVHIGFMFSVFFIGIVSGLMVGKILWERVHI